MKWVMLGWLSALNSALFAQSGILKGMSATAGLKCRAELDDNHQLQATWVFCSNTCGIYGGPDLTPEHAGRTAPVGEIVLTSSKCNVHLQVGSGMLLRVG